MIGRVCVIVDIVIVMVAGLFGRVLSLLLIYLLAVGEIWRCLLNAFSGGVVLLIVVILQAAMFVFEAAFAFVLMSLPVKTVRPGSIRNRDF